MAYRLTGITLRTNNTAEGVKKIEEIWCDITSGRLPILFDSENSFQQGISPISMYTNYATDETGDYDLSVLGVSAEFLRGVLLIWDLIFRQLTKFFLILYMLGWGGYVL